MRTVLTAAAVLGLLSAAPAMAQSTGAQTTATSPSTTSMSNNTAAKTPGEMQKDVKSDLEKAGFTDINVMPSSFLVRAKDKAGRPVMMVINPDSVTEITDVAQPGAHPGATAKN